MQGRCSRRIEAQRRPSCPSPPVRFRSQRFLAPFCKTAGQNELGLKGHAASGTHSGVLKTLSWPIVNGSQFGDHETDSLSADHSPNSSARPIVHLWRRGELLINCRPHITHLKTPPKKTCREGGQPTGRATRVSRRLTSSPNTIDWGSFRRVILKRYRSTGVDTAGRQVKRLTSSRLESPSTCC